MPSAPPETLPDTEFDIILTRVALWITKLPRNYRYSVLEAIQNDAEGEELGIVSENGEASEDSDCGEMDKPELFLSRACSLQLNR